MDVEGFDKLVRHAQAGDRQAMEQLLASLRPYLAKVASGYADPSRASASVSDLIQEVELRAWQKLPQFQGGSSDEETHAKFRTWLVQIARNISYDRKKAKERQKRKAPGGRAISLDASPASSSSDSPVFMEKLASDRPTPSAGLRETEELLQLQRALEEVLDGTDREIVRLNFFEQVSLPRIAEKLGWSFDRVRDHYRRSIRRLEEYFHSRKSK